MEEQLKEILIERLYLDLEPADINSNTELAEYGIDSFLLLELIVGIEEQFSIKFEQADINSDSLKSIASIKTLVESKL